MAKISRTVIEMDFNNAMRQADLIASISENMRKLVSSKFDGTMQNLAANWKGEEAALYLQKCGQLEESILGTASELQTAAQKIRTEARRLRQADLQALEITQS